MHINLPGFYLQNGLADLEDLYPAKPSLGI